MAERTYIPPGLRRPPLLVRLRCRLGAWLLRPALRAEGTLAHEQRDGLDTGPKERYWAGRGKVAENLGDGNWARAWVEVQAGGADG